MSPFVYPYGKKIEESVMQHGKLNMEKFATYLYLMLFKTKLLSTTNPSIFHVFNSGILGIFRSPNDIAKLP